MKKYALLICGLSITQFVNAQASWSYNLKKISDKTYDIHMTAKLQSGWHTYSQGTPEGGPVPTSITFTKNPLLIIEGKPKEDGKLEEKYEEVFGVYVKYFSNKVDFVQRVKLKVLAKTAVSGVIEYMLCTNERCLPPIRMPFKIDIK